MPRTVLVITIAEDIALARTAAYDAYLLASPAELTENQNCKTERIKSWT